MQLGMAEGLFVCRDLAFLHKLHMLGQECVVSTGWFLLHAMTQQNSYNGIYLLCVLSQIEHIRTYNNSDVLIGYVCPKYNGSPE